MNKWIEKALREGRDLLEHESWWLLRQYDIPAPRCGLARNEQELLEQAGQIGYPLVLKIVSPDILHKSDVGGVKTNIRNDSELLAACHEMLLRIIDACPTARIHGVLVCEMLPAGLETIIGMNQDPSFGPTLLFGLGGIMVELFQDVSIRVLPLDREDARQMVGEIKGAALLRGFRGEKPRDEAALADILIRLANLVEDNPEIQQIDLNPCFVYEKGAVPVDARILLAH